MIALEHVSKTFRIYRHPSDWLRERIFRRRYHESRAAISDISFSVAEGEVFGVVGRNGAGKSTLLKLIMGVLLPDTGTIRRDGRVTGLLELGTGFNSTMSGADNIVLNGTMLGMSSADIAARRDAIIDFAELAHVIDDPLRTYSTGMAMRLAFAIAVHADPACMVVDEALAVGDVHFQQKCTRRLQEFKKSGGSILFVSHDLNAVKLLCDRAMVLEEGRAVLIGTPDEAAQQYYRIIASMEGDENSISGESHAIEGGYGTGAAVIRSARLVGEKSGTAVIASGERAHLVLEVEARRALAEVTAGFSIHDRFGQIVFGTNTFVLGQNIALAEGERRSLVFTMPIDIYPGRYSVSAALHRDQTHATDCYHWYDGITAFEVAGFGGPIFVGQVKLKPEFWMGGPGALPLPKPTVNPPEFRPGNWVLITLKNGTRLSVDLGDRTISRAAMSDNWEPVETAFIQEHLPTGGVFVDIGANIGWFSIKAAEKVGPAGHVYAFEPRPDSCAALRRSVAENGFDQIVSVYNVALADQAGTLAIGWERDSDNPGGTWLIANDRVDAMMSETTHAKHRVDAVRLDDAIDPPRIDMVKIDVEGAEFRALRGAEALLRRYRPIILTEISFSLLPLCSDSTADAYLDWLLSLGYRAHPIGEVGVELAAEVTTATLPKGVEYFNIVLFPV